MKNNYWQMLRGVCIILVILIHTLFLTDSSFYNYTNIFIRRIINFSTATFIFMAGYFTKYTDIKSFYKKKFIRIIVPLILWDLIYGIINILNNNMSSSEIFKMFILSNSTSHLYYLYVLLQLFVIAPILILYINKNIDSKKIYIPLMISPIYCFFLSIYHIHTNNSFFLYNYWLFGWISYYYLGILVKNKDKLQSKKYLLLSLIFGIISITTGLIIEKNFDIYGLAISQLTFTNVLYSLFLCCFFVSIKNKNIHCNILSKFGDYSFGIYFSHMLILTLVKKINNFITLNYYVSIIIIFTITIIISYIVNALYYKKVRKLIWKK